MENDITHNSSIEELFDIQHICSAVVEQNKSVAIELFDKKVLFFKNVSCGNVDKCPNIELMSVFLNALNNGIYARALYSLGCNLQEHCFNTTQDILNTKGLRAFVLKGQDIISDYILEINAYISQNGRCQRRLYITKAKEYIEKNIDQNFTLEDVANEIFISPAYLSQLFNNLTGATYSSYVTSARINVAKKLLLTTDKTVNDVAMMAGFSQSSYFVTTFKKATGVTPKQFRATL